MDWLFEVIEWVLSYIPGTLDYDLRRMSEEYERRWQAEAPEREAVSQRITEEVQARRAAKRINTSRRTQAAEWNVLPLPAEPDQAVTTAVRRCGCNCGKIVTGKRDYVNAKHAARARKRRQRSRDGKA